MEPLHVLNELTRGIIHWTDQKYYEPNKANKAIEDLDSSHLWHYQSCACSDIYIYIYIYMMEASTATIEGIDAYSSVHLNCEMFGWNFK